MVNGEWSMGSGGVGEKEQRVEWLKCRMSAAYFIQNYVQIYNATERAWVPFTLWPLQRLALREIATHRMVIVLKARQIGLTWLCLGWALYQMIFHPAATAMLFSRRDEEAMELVGDERLRGMYKRLPAWMQCREILASNAHEMNLSNNSRAIAFPTTGGDSYTGSLVIIDEADLMPDFNRLMRAVKPTVDNGGQMILLSRANKSKPMSEFKQLYRSARAGANEWCPIFLPWNAHPGRSMAWYGEQRAEIQSRTGGLDDLYEQYPTTEEEALQPLQKDKRIPLAWLRLCYREQKPLTNAELGMRNSEGLPPQVKLYVLPQAKRRYVIGVDAAEGNPTSDDSALVVLERETGEECANLHGKFQPAITGGYALALARYYNGAEILVERNNHGHAVILWLLENQGRTLVLKGRDKRDGWLDSAMGKVLLYDGLAQACQNEEIVIHSLEAYVQLASIEGASLRAPQGEHDDVADAVALANVGRMLGNATSAGGY